MSGPKRSNLFLPGFDRPLHRQRFRTMHLLENTANEGVGSHFAGEGTLALRIEQTEPAVGIEPTTSRVRAEHPSNQDLAGLCGRYDDRVITIREPVETKTKLPGLTPPASSGVLPSRGDCIGGSIPVSSHRIESGAARGGLEPPQSE